MSDFYSATIFLSVFIMIIMDMLVSGNDLMEHDKKQTVYTISVLVIACMVSEWFGVWMDGAHPSLRTLHILVKTIELSTAPIITVLCSDLMTPLKHKKLIYTLIGVHAGLEVWGDRIFEKCGIRRDEGGDGGKTLEIRGKRRLSARDGGANYQQS